MTIPAELLTGQYAHDLNVLVQALADAEARIAALEAVDAPIMPVAPWSSSNAYATSLWAGASTSTGTATFSGGSGTIFYTPLIIPNSISITALQVEVTTAQASSTCRLGVAENDGNEPGDFLRDTGALATSSTGLVTGTFATALTTAPGFYWLAMRCSNSGVQMRALAIQSCNAQMGAVVAASPIGNVRTQLLESAAYGAFPATAGTTTKSATTPVIVQVLT